MMVFSLLSLTLLLSQNALAVDVVETASRASVQASEPIDRVIEILNQTPTGRKIIEEAKDQQLSIVPGEISKTEIVATRITQGKEERLEFNVQVIISTDKHPVFQAIDLAHELVHALHPKSNPFDPKLTAVDYVQQGIESEGGEANAILQECRVGKELTTVVAEDQAQLIKARCQYVWKTESNPSQWKQSFYHLGNQYRLFASKINGLHVHSDQKASLMKMVASKDPMFTSAAANKPYPLALLDEYLDITQKICSKSGVRRSIASVMQERCQSLSSALFSR